MTALTISGASKAFPVHGGTREVLCGLDLVVEIGEIVAVMGRSGSGKSTLLRCVGLFDRFDHGDITLAGKPSSRLSDAQRARIRATNIGFVFQDSQLLGDLSVQANVASAFCFGPKVNRRERITRVVDALSLLGLGDRKDQRARHLSGGERQRVAVARALVRQPSLILADEPTGSLDGETAAVVMDMLTTAVREHGAALILVTHDPQVGAIADRVLALESGRLTTNQPSGLSSAIMER